VASQDRLTPTHLLHLLPPNSVHLLGSTVVSESRVDSGEGE
jgi:hypothetical protein